ncbi:hypothetical protein HAX54_020442 [Datura stramonium]|uniref:Uncharacterized protein n=1 Tax=Datura stramonium TaxID=4076 RepID=A0ABS8UTI5_DATST|nr:hypothetical protein [Datura stramonium]
MFVALWRAAVVGRFCAEATTEFNLLAQNWKYDILGGVIFQNEKFFRFARAETRRKKLFFFGDCLINSFRQKLNFSNLQCLAWKMMHINWVYALVFVEMPVYGGGFAGSTSMDLVLVGFITYIDLDQLFKILASFFFRGSKLATLPRPDSVLEVLLLNFSKGLLYGCGDLIFSSHMIFSLFSLCTGPYHNVAHEEAENPGVNGKVMEDGNAVHVEATTDSV